MFCFYALPEGIGECVFCLWFGSGGVCAAKPSAGFARRRCGAERQRSGAAGHLRQQLRLRRPVDGSLLAEGQAGVFDGGSGFGLKRGL